MNRSILDAIPSGRLAPQGERLLRSRYDIARLLAGASLNGDPIATEFDDGELFFVSQILRVDDADGSVTAAWSPSTSANRRLLGCARVRFYCNHAGARIEFSVTQPREIEFAGRPALHFALPRALLMLHRRAHRRFAVPPEARLLFRAATPAGTVTAEVTDICTDGLGALLHDAAFPLARGTLLREAALLHPDIEAVAVGLRVRHTTRVRRPDGGVVRRVGCSFVRRTADLQRLIQRFVVDLDAELEAGANLP